jgi:carbon-monoxide dehydrogenase small subunit
VKQALDVTVNGEEVSVLVDTRDSLLDFLRDRLGLTGTKEGCSNGNCGACTVLVDGAPILACVVLACETAGSSVTTIEGVAEGDRLHVVQQTLIDAGGTQCGFCTPGVVLSAKALLERNPHPTDHEIRAALAGNLCRCTGYDKIVEAVQLAAGTAAER